MNGTRATAVGTADSYASGLVIQASGRIILSGWATSAGGGDDFALAAFTASGALDTSFGSLGTVLTDFGGADRSRSSAIQPDGSIVLVGDTYSGTVRVALARFTINGALDAAFSGDGRQTLAVASTNDTANDVAIDSGGNIVIGGRTYSDVGGQGDFFVARFASDGLLDPGFGAAGVRTTAVSSDEDAAYGIALQSDGKIVLVGHAPGTGGYSDLALVRYTTSGGLDTSFGSGGARITELSDRNDVAYGVIVQADDRIVVAANNGDDPALVRYGRDGTLDPTFGAGGIRTTDLGNGHDAWYALASQGDSKIIATGTKQTTGFQYDLALARFLGVTTPAVTAVTVPADGMHLLGEHLDFSVTLSEAVAVTGTPSIPVTLDTGGTVQASYLGGSGTATLQFRYTIAAGDADLDGIRVVGPISLNGGSIASSQGAAALALNGMPSTTGVHVDTLPKTLTVTLVGGGTGTVTTNPTGVSCATGSAAGCQYSFPRGTAVTATATAASGSTFLGWGTSACAGSMAMTANIACVARFGASPPTSSVAGALDPTFGTGGTLTTQISAGADQANGVVAQPDGKIVVVGYSNSGWAIARYEADGSLDPAFGTGGRVATSFGSSDAQATSVMLQPDGKIVVAGNVGSPGYENLAIARYGTDGALDTGFGLGGTRFDSLSPRTDRATSLALQGDGKIVVAGYADDGGLRHNFLVVRYTASGDLDSGFGVGGSRVSSLTAPSHNVANAVVVQPDGRIILGGWTGNGFTAARYTAAGTLDASFGAGGFVSIAGTGQANGMTLQPDGKVVLVGFAWVNGGYDMQVARVTTAGVADGTFGASGVATTAVGERSDQAYAVTTQPDGKLLVAGLADGNVDGEPIDLDFALLRFTSTGVLDGTFGAGGISTTGVGPSFDVPASIAIQPDGRILLAGSSLIGSNYDFAVARFLATTSPGVPATQVTTVTAAAGRYTEGDFIEVVVHYAAPVAVSGEPTVPINLEVGGTVQATYVAGGPSDTVRFRYTVARDDRDRDGIALGGAIVLNGGAIGNARGAAGLTLSGVAGMNQVVVGPDTSQLTVIFAGTGTGFVYSDVAGINCSAGTCQHDFATGTSVRLTVTATGSSTFSGWSDPACASSLTLHGGVTCVATFTAATSQTFVPPVFTPPVFVQPTNPIVQQPPAPVVDRTAPIIAAALPAKVTVAADGSFAATIQCPATEVRCMTVLTVSAPLGTAARVTAKVALTTKVTVAGGTRKVIKLRLPPALRKAVTAAAKKHLAVRVQVRERTTDASGNARETTRIVQLRLAPKGRA